MEDIYLYCYYYYYYCLNDEGVAAMDDEVGDYLVVEKKRRCGGRAHSAM